MNDLFSWKSPSELPPQDPYFVMDCHGKIVPRDVVKMFDEMALKMANTGRPRYSVRMITSVMCWHRHLEYADRPFKINHNWTSDNYQRDYIAPTNFKASTMTRRHTSISFRSVHCFCCSVSQAVHMKPISVGRYSPSNAPML